jgi:hypothetical protein
VNTYTSQYMLRTQHSVDPELPSSRCRQEVLVMQVQLGSLTSGLKLTEAVGQPAYACKAPGAVNRRKLYWIVGTCQQQQLGRSKEDAAVVAVHTKVPQAWDRHCFQDSGRAEDFPADPCLSQFVPVPTWWLSTPYITPKSQHHGHYIQRGLILRVHLHSMEVVSLDAIPFKTKFCQFHGGGTNMTTCVPPE